jgi:acetolactate synthase I/II/III large subunit
MRLADYVIQFLADKGIDTMFVVNGAANGYLVDAFARVKNARYIAVMHEQGGGFAAEGYAKVSGKPGVAIATSGPGGMNLVTPIGNFYYDSVPGVFLTGQINSGFLRTDPSIRQVGFQETDIVGIVTPITKYAKLIMKPEDIRYELEKAFFLTTDRRPGPVLLDIPQNIQKTEIDPAALRGFDPSELKVAYDTAKVEEQIDKLIEDLKKAKRPVFMIGGGVRTAKAVEELLEVGRKVKIPMFPTWNAIDTVPTDYEYYGGLMGTYGGRGRNFGVQNSDLLIAIGSRISGRITGGNVKSFAREAKKYTVDVDPALLKTEWQQVPFDENIYCDAKLFLELFAKKLESAAASLPDQAEWRDRVFGWRDKYDPVRPEYADAKDFVNPYVLVRELSRQMKKDDIYVVDCGGNVVVSNQAFNVKHGQRYMTNNGNSPMGFSYAGALGAYTAAKPGQNVVAMIGDGGFNMNLQELQTMKVYGLKTKTFIMNNHIYGIIKAFQDTNLDGRYEAVQPGSYVPPDFIKISQAYGVKTVTIKNHAELESKIAEVLAADEPVICDVDCGEWYEYAPRIFGWKTPIEDMYPYLPRDEFRANMIIAPLEGWENPEIPGTDKAKKAGTME